MILTLTPCSAQHSHHSKYHRKVERKVRHHHQSNRYRPSNNYYSYNANSSRQLGTYPRTGGIAGTKYGNYYSCIELNNAYLKKDNGSVVLYIMDRYGDFIFVRRFYPHRRESYSFTGVLNLRNVDARVISGGGYLRLTLNGSGFPMY